MQPQQQGARVRQPTAGPNPQPATTPESEEPSSPSSSTSSSEHQQEVAKELGPTQTPTAASPAASLNAHQKAPAIQPPAEPSNHSNPKDTGAMQIEPASPSSSANENANPPQKETVMEEAIRVTRGRLRKSRATMKR